MKKFLLVAFATLLTYSVAISQPQVASQRPVKRTVNLNVNTSRQLQHTVLPFQKQSARALHNNQMTKSLVKGALKSAQRRAASVITNQPEGTYYNMAYATDYYGYSLFGLYNGTHDSALSEVVEGTDGNLYLHNIVSELYTEEGYWVKAEKVESKADTYVIHPQPIYIEDYYGTIYTYNITKMKITSEGSVVPDGNGDITLTWKNQKVTISDIFGAADATSNGWSGCLNWNASMTVLTDKAIKELPAGVQAFDASMIYSSQLPAETGDQKGTMVKMAIDGNDVYLHITDEFDSWIKGTINGQTVSFPAKQYLGGSQSYNLHIYFMTCDISSILSDKITFAYDADSKRLTNTDSYMVINGSKKKLYYLDLYGAPVIAPYIDAAHTPLPASNFGGSNYIRSYGYGYLDFDAPTFDAEGNFLNPNNLYYRVYLGYDYDEEKGVCNKMKQFVFTPEEYAELTENTTDIPFTFSGYNFWNNGSSFEFVYYFNRACWVGIQTVYRGGGQENVSEISWYGDHNGITGSESFFPQIEDPDVFTTSLANDEMVVKAGEPSSKTFTTGSVNTETYDVAIKITAEDLAHGAKLTGKKITGISIPFFETNGITNVKAWLATSLNLNEDGTFTPNIVSKDFTPKAQDFTTVRFDQAYDIPAEGLYVGYTLTAEPNATPIILSENGNDACFIVHTSHVYSTGWANIASDEGNLAIEAIVSGCEAHAAEIKIPEDIYAKVNEPALAKVQVANYGSKGLSNISYDYLLAGNDVEIKNSADVNNLNIKPVFGAYKTVKVEVPAAPKTGGYFFSADVKKANGQDNGIEDYAGDGCVTVVDFLPTKRPLLEEYTGTWCGYCPRGYVALEKMAQLYPEDFIALSYHNDDPMEVMSSYEFPSVVEGFPTAWLDREWELDAYYGTTGKDLGIEQTWKERCTEFTPADINVEASWSEDGKTINIKTKASFAAAVSYPTISYAVVADGLTGSGDDWAQSNYYSDQAYGTPKYMEQFYNGASAVEGLVFNDVLVAVAEQVEGSLPEEAEAGKTYEHTYSFNAANILNTAGDPVIQDKNKVKVVASIINAGIVINANKCKVTSATNGIDDRNALQQAVKTTYYDMSGRKVLVPSNGVYLKNVQYQDGTNHTEKVMIK